MMGAYSKGDLLAICNSSMGALGGGQIQLYWKFLIHQISALEKIRLWDHLLSNCFCRHRSLELQRSGLDGPR